MHELAQDVLRYIRRQELLKAGSRVGVAVSGGADSVALLRLMLELRKELGVVLSVVHFNHKLRGAESDADARFVAELAQAHQLPFHVGSQDVAGHAAEHQLGLEAAARTLRYGYFRSLVSQGLTHVATAHTLDDQAETVLLRLVRGAGTRGLAGIYPKLEEPSSPLAVIRPLLATRRRELQKYLNGLGQTWREDLSNRDLRFARNRVRHEVLPRLERNLNPEVHRALAETAEIARGEEDYWRRATERILARVGKQGTLELSILDSLPLALQRRVVRAMAESIGLTLEFSHVEEVLDASTGSVALPRGWTTSRSGQLLRFALASAEAEIHYEYRLAVPGEVSVPELDVVFEAARVLIGNDGPEYNPEHLFDPSRLARGLVVRNWRPGDRFWPAHTKAPKKIKELLQERHVTGRERQTWPVVTSGDEIIWLRGFPGPAQMQPQAGATDAIAIREKPVDQD